MEKVILEADKCNACGLCIEVCPRDVFKIDDTNKKVIIAQEVDCGKCAACVYQCPTRAAHFYPKSCIRKKISSDSRACECPHASKLEEKVHCKICDYPDKHN